MLRFHFYSILGEKVKTKITIGTFLTCLMFLAYSRNTQNAFRYDPKSKNHKLKFGHPIRYKLSKTI